LALSIYGDKEKEVRNIILEKSSPLSPIVFESERVEPVPL
jgi:hypothetical protein